MLLKLIKWIALSAVPLSFLVLSYLLYLLTKPVAPPILENTWWGPGEPRKDDLTIRPFKINVSEEVLQDLKYRLESVRPLTAPLEGSKHHYGLNTVLLENVLEFWKKDYNWREREELLNQFPQYVTQIQGLDIHYLHVKPQNPKDLRVVPLIIFHGWPGSFKEFHLLIPMLTTPRADKDFVFELIIPSLPGFGFSQASSKPGLGPAQMGVIFKNLMERLGFKNYYTQGGDFGALIVSAMGAMYPDRISGCHLNLCFNVSPLGLLKYALGSIYPRSIVEEKYEHLMYPLFGNKLYFMLLETGYFHQHATKPDTFGVGLGQSPVGLAAHILEKFITASNPSLKDRIDGGLKDLFTYEDLLDNIMIYWVTNTATTSIRIYSEWASLNYQKMDMERVPVNVPTACLRLPHEIDYQPNEILKSKYQNLVHVTDKDVGGHFAAMEVPEILSEDIWSAVEKMESLKST